MGVAYCVATEKTLAGVEVEDFGSKALARADEHFEKDAVYETAGVLPLMHFFGDDPRDMLGDEGFDDVPEENISEKWFDAADGLGTVAALKRHLEGNPKMLKNSKAVLADLDHLEQLLTACQQQGVRWHLSMDF